MESKKIFKTLALRTLAYADLFGYAMTEDELLRWLIATYAEYRKLNGNFHKYVNKLNGVIYQEGGFFFLEARNHLVSLRRKHEREAKVKLLRARTIARFLSLIPTVRLIGISGSLAMKNTDTSDDIDLFIVTRAGSLWLTRLLCVMVLEIMGVRRRPDDFFVKDSVCLNMFVDENHLSVPKDERNIYSAHEVCQLQVLLDRDVYYKRFLYENGWVRKYLPNAIKDMKILRNEVMKKQKKSVFNFLIAQLLNYFELLAKSFQFLYMYFRKRQVSRRTEGVLTFFPKKYHVQILRAYEKRLNEYGLSI